MRFSALLVSGLVPWIVLVAFGCSNKQPQIAAPTPKQVQLPKPYLSTPARRTGASAQTSAPPKNSSPVVAKVDEKELAEYGRRLAVIMGAKEIADRQWNASMRKSATELDKKGLQILREPFTRYSAAVSKASDSLRDLKPPKFLAAFHSTLADSLDRLDENLQLSVEAINSDNGADAAHFAEERKQIFKQGAEAGIVALDKSGIDVGRYLSDHVLVRK